MTAAAGPVRRWQNVGYGTGALAGLLALVVLLMPGAEQFHALGPMNTGHEDLHCPSCHKDAPGTYRQQIQAALRHLAGGHAAPGDFGQEDVGNEACIACHERPDDRHPVYRFLEPRFAKVRETLGPQHCVSCHLEHNSRRVTLADAGYCVGCHEDTKLRRDPVDVPHERLIALKRWDTCLGCHDFHGNHVMTTATAIDSAIPPARIRAYFDGGPSPFGDVRRHQARKEADDD